MLTRIGKKKTRERTAKPANESSAQAEQRRERCIAQAVKILGKDSRPDVEKAIRSVDGAARRLEVFGQRSFFPASAEPTYPWMPTKSEQDVAEELQLALTQDRVVTPSRHSAKSRVD